MALINCPECNAEVSDTALSCPHCGFGVKEYVEKQAAKAKVSEVKPKSKFWIGVVCVLGIVVVIGMTFFQRDTYPHLYKFSGESIGHQLTNAEINDLMTQDDVTNKTVNGLCVVERWDEHDSEKVMYKVGTSAIVRMRHTHYYIGTQPASRKDYKTMCNDLKKAAMRKYGNPYNKTEKNFDDYGYVGEYDWDTGNGVTYSLDFIREVGDNNAIIEEYY